LLYRCALEIAGERFENIEALATRRHYAIVGRNVLCHLAVKVDGPKEQLAWPHQGPDGVPGVPPSGSQRGERACSGGAF
jgi:hypothetical protein